MSARLVIADALADALHGVRVVPRPRGVDLGGQPLVQVALASLELGTGEDALRRTATVEVYVVVPGDGDTTEDRLEALLAEVLEVLDALDAGTWTSARRTTYPPGTATAVAFLITLTSEV